MQEKQSDRAKGIDDQIAILKRLDNSLIKFFKSRVSYSSLSDDDQKKLKDLKKKASEMREGVQEVLDNLQGANYSVTSSNMRFASSEISQRVVKSFLNKSEDA